MPKRKYSELHGMATKVKPREGADGKAFVQPSRNYTAPSSAGTKDNSGGSRTSKPPRKPIGDRPRRRRNAQKFKRQGFLDPKPSSGGDDHGGKLTHRKRSDEDGPSMDEKYIRSHYKVPTIQDYPTAPSTVLGAKFDFGVLHNAVKSMLKLRTGCELIGNTMHRFVIRYTPPGGEEQSVIGEDAGRRQATRAAYVHLLARLHEQGILGDIFLPPVVKLDNQTLKDEGGAKVDIYNYAARFGLVPKFSIRKIERPARQLGKSQVQVTVELPEQGIKVAARQFDLSTAEIAAAVRFKQEAEKFHAEHGDGSIVIKDSAALTTDNVKHFFDFYRLKNKGSVFECTIEQAKLNVRIGGGAHVWDASVTLNGEPIGSTVSMSVKKKAEDTAYLVAGVALLQKDPEMMEEFRSSLSASGEILMPIRPTDMEIDMDALTIMQETLRDVRHAGLHDDRRELTSEGDADATRSMRVRKPLTEDEIKVRSKVLEIRYKGYMESPALAELRSKKEALPMTQYRDKVISHIGNNQYSVIVGATGSGKTTQVPQILLEDAITKHRGAACNVICTQPRRIAATSVAQRVADERNENLQDTVGYHVRFDAKLPSYGGSITYCTTGILLKQLQQAPDEVFDRVSHIIIDEVHERDIMIDFLLIIVKEAVRTRRLAGKSTPKVVLMSATINSELFGKYFEEISEDGKILDCPSLSVPGRTFPVKEKYYENIIQELQNTYPPELKRYLQADVNTGDYMSYEHDMSKTTRATGDDENDQVGQAVIDWKRERTVTSDGQSVNEKEDALLPINLVAATVAHVSKTTQEGAILVFLPGLDEIKKVRQALLDRPLGVNFNDESSYKLFILHSSVPAADQSAVFNPVPAGCRKIILSTNIAETSVTIPDIQHVIDTGKLREKRYDQVRRITRLQCTWISKSNAKQRAGRAGRVRNGNYYALYSRSRYESLRAIGLPEMLRSDLSEVCLDIKAQAFKTPIRDFLSRAIEAPPPEAVAIAVDSLKSLEALTEDEDLTPLGRLLASLPVHPALGKMIVLGVIFRCLDPMIILGAALNERNIFVAPPDKRREAAAAQCRFLEGSNSDHYALVNAFSQMRQIKQKYGQSSAYDFAMRNYIHMGAFRTLESTTHQIEDLLIDAGLIPWTHPNEKFESEMGHPKLNKNSSNMQLIKALLLAGTHPNLAKMVGRTFRTPGEKNARIHPSSLNGPVNQARMAESQRGGGELYIYSTMSRGDANSITLRDTTAATPLLAVLFGGKLKAQGNIIQMDGWLPFYVKGQNRAVRVIMEFRKAMDRLLTAAFQELSVLRNQKGSKSAVYLADDERRETFASGLVEVLSKDVYKPPPMWTGGGGGRRGEGRGGASTGGGGGEWRFRPADAGGREDPRKASAGGGGSARW